MPLPRPAPIATRTVTPHDVALAMARSDLGDPIVADAYRQGVMPISANHWEDAVIRELGEEIAVGLDLGDMGIANARAAYPTAVRAILAGF